MSVWTRRPGLRWLVPGLAAALVVGGGAAANALGSQDDEPDLPPRTAAELLVDLQTAEVGAGSGTLVVTADLGLPELSGSGRQGEADLGSLWSGSHTMRLWYDGPERVRLALLGTLSQSDIIRNGTDLWIWDSAENHASHRELPEGAATHPGPPGPALSPQAAAESILAAIEPSTEVSAEETTRVADRDAPLPKSAFGDVVRLAGDSGRDVEEVARCYFGLGVRFGFDWLREAAAQQPRDLAWNRLAITALIDDLYESQARATAGVLQGSAPGKLEDGVEAWVEPRHIVVMRSEQLLGELQAASPNLAMLMVANRQLKTLTEVS